MEIYKEDLFSNTMVDLLISSWKSNDSTRFLELFAKDAEIHHPYFGEPVSPKTAAEVINSAVSPHTKLLAQERVSGCGNGINDVIKIKFQEIGNKGNRKLKHICEIELIIEVVNRKIVKMIILQFNSLMDEQFSNSEEISRINLGKLSSKEIADLLAECWGNNDMRKFISLFSEQAKINHPALSKPVSAVEIADIMNSDVDLQAELKSLKIISGSGSGAKDYVEFKFNEEGRRGIFRRKIKSIMNISAYILDHKIQEMTVHGYSKK